MTTGRLDTRFSGPTLDPLSKEAEYDPQSAAISSAYVSAFNDYVRKELKYGENRDFQAGNRRLEDMELPASASGFPGPAAAGDERDARSGHRHEVQSGPQSHARTPAISISPRRSTKASTKCSTCRFRPNCRSNIEFKFYESGHMVYAHEASLKALHDNVAAFILKTENSKAAAK